MLDMEKDELSIIKQKLYSFGLLNPNIKKQRLHECIHYLRCLCFYFVYMLVACLFCWPYNKQDTLILTDVFSADENIPSDNTVPITRH